MENHSSGIPPKTEVKAKPIFPKMLAWFGVFWNLVYLAYTVYNILHNYPKNIVEYIFVALVTITFGIVYLKMINKFSARVQKISTILAIIWLVFLVFKFFIMKTKSESIETLFVLGAIYTVIVNVIALHQVKKFHNSQETKTA
jgi:chromate transport protein ChrA